MIRPGGSAHRWVCFGGAARGGMPALLVEGRNLTLHCASKGLASTGTAAIQKAARRVARWAVALDRPNRLMRRLAAARTLVHVARWDKGASLRSDRFWFGPLQFRKPKGVLCRRHVERAL